MGYDSPPTQEPHHRLRAFSCMGAFHARWNTVGTTRVSGPLRPLERCGGLERTGRTTWTSAGRRIRVAGGRCSRHLNRALQDWCADRWTDNMPRAFLPGLAALVDS